MEQEQTSMKNDEMDKKKIDLIRQILQDHQYELIHPIGFGGFSSVYLVRSTKYNAEFACKVSDINQNNGCISEVKVLRKLSHPNILFIYDFFYYSDTDSTLNFSMPRKRKKLHKMILEEKAFVEVIMDKTKRKEIQNFEPKETNPEETKGINLLFVFLEYCPNGSLSDYLKQHKVISPPLLYSFCSQAAEAIAYCHNKKVVHRDIKPGNFLLDANNRIKLADFGLSTSLTGNEDNDFFMGSRVYMSPELFSLREYDPYKNDIWSLGVTFYELSSGSIPWQNYNDQQMRIAITVGNFNFQNCQGSPQFIKLMKEMLQTTEETRCSIDYVTQHEALNNKPVYPFPKSLSINSISLIHRSETEGNDSLRLPILPRKMSFTAHDFAMKSKDSPTVRSFAHLPNHHRKNLSPSNDKEQMNTHLQNELPFPNQSGNKPAALPPLPFNLGNRDKIDNGNTDGKTPFRVFPSGRRISQPHASSLSIFRNPQKLHLHTNSMTFSTIEPNESNEQ